MSWKSVLASLLGMLVVAGVAAAVVEAPILDYEVRLPQSQNMRTYVQPGEAQAAGLLPSLLPFRNGEGAGWRLIQWNAELGTPAAIVGPAIPISSSDASEEAIRTAVEGFVARNQELLGVDLRDLRISDVVDLGGERKYVIFNQYVDGLEVLFGRLDVALWKGGVVLLGSEVYPDVQVNRFPAIDERTAAEAAHLGIPRHASDAVQGTPRLVILPLEPAGKPEYHLAWEIFLKTAEPENVWRTYVDAHDATVLWRQSEYAFFQINGTMRGDVEETFNHPYNYPFEDARVRASGSYTDYTDEAGNFTIEVPNNVDYDNVAQMYGYWCNVNRGDGFADASISILGGPGDPVNFYFNDTNSHAAERSAFYHVNVVHDWIKSIDPTFVDLDYVMGANVNLNGTCNAFWNGSSVNFYKEGGGCNNSGRIADVIYHEYGHGITQELYSPQQPPYSSGMGEAFSDVDAMCIHRDAEVGEYFNIGGAPVRNGENLRQYPGTECGGEVHCLGEILMGAMWKTEKFFMQKYAVADLPTAYDALYITAVKTKQTNMPSFLTRLLMANDTDGDLTNGTKDWYEICDAFVQHNLPCPPLTDYVTVSSEPLDDQPQDSGGYVVTAIIQAVGGGALDPNQLEIYYTTEPVGTRTTWQTVLMTPTGNPDEYSGEIPHQDCGSVVTYYVRAAKTTGEFATAPHLAPYRDVYKFFAGPMITTLSDDLEADQGWTIGWAGDNATDGQWERADPVGKNSVYGLTQPEDDHTAVGNLCFVTDPLGGTWSANDVDGGRTTVVSPVQDWSDRAAASIGFWYFFFDYMPTDDSLRCSISNDNGATWTDLVKINGMGLNQWQYAKLYVTSDEVPFTDQMRVRFQMEDIRWATTCAEAAVDDIEIRVSECLTVDVAEDLLPARFTVERNRPNPFNPRTSIRFGLPEAGHVDVGIYDAAGRKVRSLLDGTRNAGYHTLVWDGRDDQGHAVGSGVYYYTVKTDRESQGYKMMLLK